MADLCDNYLFVRGPTFEVEVFIMNHFDVVNGDAWLDLDSIIPYPEKYRRLDEIAERWEDTHRDSGSAEWASRPTDGYNQGGKTWCEKNWGTKWNTYAYGPGVFYWELDDERSAYTQLCFDTAWTPVSRRVLLVLSRIYPKSTFELRYAESEHRGRIRTRGGSVLIETRYRRRYTGNMNPPHDLIPRTPRR